MLKANTVSNNENASLTEEVEYSPDRVLVNASSFRVLYKVK